MCELGGYFIMSFQRYSGSRNKPLWTPLKLFPLFKHLWNDSEIKVCCSVFLFLSRESLTNLSNRDISVCPFAQWFTFFTFQLSDTDMMIHTHTQAHIKRWTRLSGVLKLTFDNNKDLLKRKESRSKNCRF